MEKFEEYVEELEPIMIDAVSEPNKSLKKVQVRDERYGATLLKGSDDGDGKSLRKVQVGAAACRIACQRWSRS